MNESASSTTNVLITLADKNFIPQAKQLFSSAYWNGGWQGDFLLLAHEVPEEDLRWFREKGIIVFPCKPLSEKELAGLWHPSIVLDKFYLFTPFFKQWKRIVFLDADIIVRASIGKLTDGKEPFSSPNAHGTSLRKEFIKKTKKNRELFGRLEKEYPLQGKAFNSGIMSFSADVIQEDSFKKLMELYQRFGELNKYGEEATINLLFYRNWHMLSPLYNTYPWRTHHLYDLSYNKIQAVILHFVRETTAKPWLETSPFHEEWLANFERADSIDLLKPQNAAKTWTSEEEKRYLRSLAVRRSLTFYRWALFAADWAIGRIGLLIKKLSPALYEKVHIKN